MNYPEQLILGAITMVMLELGADVHISAVGEQGLLSACLADKEATPWLKVSVDP